MSDGAAGQQARQVGWPASLCTAAAVLLVCGRRICRPVEGRRACGAQWRCSQGRPTPCSSCECVQWCVCCLHWLVLRGLGCRQVWQTYTY